MITNNNIKRNTVKKIIFFLIVLFTQFMLFAQSNRINVPDDFTKIQDAINSSVDGDTILVAPGTYYENVNFRGKNVVLTSHYVFDEDVSFINTTIIDGGKPHSPDTASVVIFLSNEENTATLQGFTITGGKGTKIDVGLFVRVGGGIIIFDSSPTIRHNIIAFNESINSAGVSFKSGGGISADNSSAIISNNIIYKNNSQDGGGVQLGQNPESIFMNNIVAYNTYTNSTNGVGRGGGVWIRGDQGKFINNTIAFNSSGKSGGLGLVHNPIVNIENCIIYGNTAGSSNPQIVGSGIISVTNSNIEGGWAGAGNIDENPLFIEYSPFILQDDSPCVDMGDTSTASNDWEDPDNRGFALSPALGTLRNDMGAYGGNQYSSMPYMRIFDLTKIFVDSSPIKSYFAPGIDTVVISSKIVSPEDQPIDVNAFIKSLDGSIVDSIIMLDNGNIKDSLAGDGWYTAIWIPNSEKSYSVDINVFLSDYKELISLENAFNFTTKGPIIVDTYNIYKVNDTLIAVDDLVLLNLGEQIAVGPITAVLKPVSACIAGVPNSTSAFGMIEPGETKSAFFTYGVSVGDCAEKIELELEISMGQYVYWKDTLIIEYPLVDVENKYELPRKFELAQNYPNPFNPSTKIKYSIQKKSYVTLRVFDVLGREVTTLIQKEQPQGNYEIGFDASHLTSGIYFYRIQTGEFVDVKKMLLLK